jgi:hypothetical protein
VSSINHESHLDTNLQDTIDYSNYNNKVQRICYNGIVEFNEELELALSSDFTELFSTGKLYYNQKEVAISLKPKQTIPVSMFMWDLDAIVEDANARNSTFLNFIKSKFSN